MVGSNFRRQTTSGSAGKCGKRIGTLAVAVGFAGLILGSAIPARATGLTIYPTFDSTITSNPNAAMIEATINQAIQVYATKFSDPISVTVKFENMGGGLGQSSKWIGSLSYSDCRAALASDATTASDATALLHLPISSNNPVDGQTSLSLSTANFRAIGISATPPDGFDGTISLNLATMNLSRTGPLDPNKYDLMSVAMHEIDEVLGLGSDIGQTYPMPEDLFRYDTSGNRSYTTSTSAQAWFSIDGTTLLDQFDQSGGGLDYGDWIKHNPAQVQDAIGTPGSHPDLNAAELTALDVIGYNPVVPEPAAISLAALGVLALVSPRHRR